MELAHRLNVSTHYTTLTKLRKDFPFSPCLIPMKSHHSSYGDLTTLNLNVQIFTFLHFTWSKLRKRLKKETIVSFEQYMHNG